jgi:hypothetical protein
MVALGAEGYKRLRADLFNRSVVVARRYGGIAAGA